MCYWIFYNEIFVLTRDRRQSKTWILSTNVDQKYVETKLSISIWQLKTLFLAIFILVRRLLRAFSIVADLVWFLWHLVFFCTNQASGYTYAYNTHNLVFSCLLILAFWSPAGKGLTSWLSCMWCFIVFLSLPHVVSWVRCGAWLHRFQIFVIGSSLIVLSQMALYESLLKLTNDTC